MEAPTYARLEARIPTEVHQLIKQAAGLEGRTMTDFVIKALSDAAHQTIEQTGIIRLSAADQKRFAEALFNPPEPNEALRRALSKHDELFGK